MCLKAFIESSSGLDSGPEDEFRNEENTLCPAELGLWCRSYNNFHSHEIYCPKRNMWFNFLLIPDFAVPGNGMLGRREQFMKQTTGMRRRNNGSYPPVTRALVIEQTSPKIRWFS